MKKYFKKHKAKYYKKKEGYKPKKPIFRINKKINECQYYFCKEKGHYDNECLKRFNKKTIEIEDEIKIDRK